jgi:flagellar basal-body rod modification protein FlgD
MAAITNTQATSSGSSAVSNAISSNGEVSNLFTTLLVAQIKYQNPLEPQDPSEFVSQMTQLSQMETLQAMTKQTGANGAMLESLQVLALGGQVGTSVAVATDRIVVDSQPITGRFTLADASEEVALVIRGANGTQRRIDFGVRSSGDVSFSIDPSALGLEPGSYSIAVSTANGQTPPVEINGTLESVRMSGTDGLIINVSGVGQTVPTAITAFNGKTAQQAG